MRSTKATRWLSGTLAALMLAQGMCLPAGAWSLSSWFGGGSSQTSQVTTLEAKAADVQLQSGTAVIPEGANEATVKQALYEALVVNTQGVDPQSLEWEYYCTGRDKSTGLVPHDAWGSIEGFTSKSWGVTYIHPALAANEDGSYQVRIKDTTAEVTLIKQSGKTSVINAKDSTVALTYNSDGTVNYDNLRAAIFNAVVTFTTPDLDWDDVTIEYWATSRAGTNHDWASLSGETKDVIYVYPAISANESAQQIRISYNGGNVNGTNYLPTSTQVNVTITAGRETPVITLKDDCTVSLHDGELDAVRQEILDKVVNETGAYNLTTSNTTIEYYAKSQETGWISNWVALEGGTVDLVKYPAISDGTHKIRVTFHGSDTYESATSNEVEVRFVSKQDSSIIPNEGTYTVGLTYEDATTVDYDQLREDIFAAVVDSTTPRLTVDDVTIEYWNNGLNGFAATWVPLNGKDLYPAISEGEQKIKISWGGNDDYYGFEKEVTVSITGREQAPYTPKETPDAVTLTVDESLNVNYADLRKAIFNAVVASSDVIKVDDVTVEYYYNGITEVDSKWLPLEGQAVVGGLGYPAISAGQQKIRISWPGNQQYAPTTIEATVEVKDREQVQFTLNEGHYEVGMVFNAEQGYDYAATAKAIYGAVVASTSPVSLSADDVTVEYNADKTGITDSFKPLDWTGSTGLLKFGTGTWEIRISWAGNQTYRGNSVIVDVTTTDNRIASAVVLKNGASFTYNMDADVMKQAIFDNVIDWDNSTLPAKETLSLDNFIIEYEAKLTDAESGVDLGQEDLEDLFGGIFGNKLDDIVLTQWVPLEGKVYSIGNTVLGQFPQIGAGENQSIRISYKGNADYRPSDSAEGTVTVNKAKVSVKVNSTNIYADEALPENFITTDPVDEFDIYTIYAGITSNVTTGIYLDLPDRYTADGSLLLQLIDKALAAANQKTLTQMLNDGVTVGELRQMFSTQELLDLLDKLNIDTGTFGQILTVINNLPGIMDSVRISFGTPNRAGLYTVAAVTDSKNYETGVGIGFLLTKMHFSGPKLTWNQEISGKLTAEQAKNFDFGATLSYNGDVTVNQEGVHYLYSGFTSKWRVYSSTTTPPTEPGSYVVTVCILGGNYMAAPITRSFQITK